MNSLHTIKEDFLEALEVAIEYQENGEEIPEEILEALEVKEEEFATKALKYSFVLDLAKSQEELYKQHRKMSMEATKSLQKKQEKLKSMLLQALLLFGEDKKLTKSQIAKGLSRGGKIYKVLNEDGAVTLSETIKQEFEFNSDSLEEKDYNVTIELDGSFLEKLRDHKIDFTLKDQKLKDKAIIEKYQQDQIVLKSIEEDLKNPDLSEEDRKTFVELKDRILRESKVKNVEEVSSLRITRK